MKKSSQKIRSTHLARRAVVYVRQATRSPAGQSRESTPRQYALGQLAVQLGWAPGRVQVVDEDIGRSGASAEGRSGYQRLVEDVSQGRVGAILVVDVSRLTRSWADWRGLVDLCARADVLIVDELGVLAAADPSDRLLLAPTGQMSARTAAGRRA